MSSRATEQTDSEQTGGDSLHLKETIPPEGQGQKGQPDYLYFPKRYVSIRITHDNREDVEACFAGYNALVGREFSSKKVEHYHAVLVIDEIGHAAVKKRIQRLKLGKAMVNSKVNSGTFVKAVSYSTKQGDWKILGGHFTPELVQHCQDAWKREATHTEERIRVKDTDRDWQLTAANLVRVAYNYWKEHGMTTTDLGHVLKHMEDNTRWIPSPTLLKGLDDFYFDLFRKRVDKTAPNTNWWARTPDYPVKKRMRYESI